jgi:hypothetical protein
MMPISLLKVLASSALPLRLDGASNAHVVSKLVFAGLIEADFHFAGGRSDLYRGDLDATVTAITPAGRELLASLQGSWRSRKPRGS